MADGKAMLSYQRNLEVRYDAEVLVVGGGPAGIAAAMAVQAGPDTRSIDVRELQARLKAMGAYLPNLKGSRAEG